MGDIKRQITDVADIKRGSTNIEKVYRAQTLIWQRTTPVTPGFSVNTWDIDTGYCILESADPAIIQTEKIAEIFKIS